MYITESGNNDLSKLTATTAISETAGANLAGKGEAVFQGVGILPYCFAGCQW